MLCYLKSILEILWILKYLSHVVFHLKQSSLALAMKDLLLTKPFIYMGGTSFMPCWCMTVLKSICSFGLSGIHFPLQMQTLDWSQSSNQTYFLLTAFMWKPCEFGELYSFLFCTERAASLEVILYRKLRHLSRVWWTVLIPTSSWLPSCISILQSYYSNYRSILFFYFPEQCFFWGTKPLSLPISKVTCIYVFTTPWGYCKQQGNHRRWEGGRGGKGKGDITIVRHTLAPRGTLSISSSVRGEQSHVEANEVLFGQAIFVQRCARARMLKLEGLRRAGQRNPAADEPKFDRICSLSHHPALNLFPQKQGRQLHRACELINKPCRRWPGLYRAVLDICLHDCICQQTRKAACRELTVAGPWGVRNQFITIITKLFLCTSSLIQQNIATASCLQLVGMSPSAVVFFLYSGSTLLYPVKCFWMQLLGKIAIKMYSFGLLMLCPVQGSKLFLIEDCFTGLFLMQFIDIWWW